MKGSLGEALTTPCLKFRVSAPLFCSLLTCLNCWAKILRSWLESYLLYLQCLNLDMQSDKYQVLIVRRMNERTDTQEKD